MKSAKAIDLVVDRGLYVISNGNIYIAHLATLPIAYLLLMIYPNSVWLMTVTQLP